MRKASAPRSLTHMAVLSHLDSRYRKAGSHHPKGKRGAARRPTAAGHLARRGESARCPEPAMRH
ncbi:MAG: hypothetical protein OXU37_02510 [Thaumarchaeota archaeon]|nr:hypothetical protein [Nitrososphaerota archaeon]